MPAEEVMDTLKLAAFASVFGALASIVLGLINGAVASLVPWASYLVSILALVYFVPHLPREMKTFFGLIVVVLGILVIQGIVSMLNIPQVSSFLNWANINSFPNFITTVVSAVVGLYIADKLNLV